MTPAMPPLPTASYLRFHWAGSHSSKLASGRTTPATRQNAGTLRGGAPGAAFGSTNEPAGIFAADLIAMPGSESLVRLSQDGCATAGIAASNSHGSATIARRNMDITPPRLAAIVPRPGAGCQCYTGGQGSRPLPPCCAISLISELAKLLPQSEVSIGEVRSCGRHSFSPSQFCSPVVSPDKTPPA